MGEQGKIEDEAGPKASPRWRRALPSACAAALIGSVFRRVDYKAFGSALSKVNVPLFALFTLAFLLALLTADSVATVFVYRRSVAKVGYREFWILRGASY